MMDGFNPTWKVSPVRVSGGGRTDWGQPLPEDRTELPDALFAPGPSSEDNLLRTDTVRRATLRWPRQQVHLEPEDRIDIDGQEYQVQGYPNIWPLGTTAVLERPR